LVEIKETATKKNEVMTNARVKRAVKFKVVAYGGLMAKKKLIMTIHVNFVLISCLNCCH